jgi:hypothetical protein
MEFKGTKGNWKLAENEYGYYTSVRNLDDSRKVCTSRVNNQIESNANLLLISKAPEMLDFINRISGEMLRSDFVLNEKWYEQARQLIKEATEL